MAALGDAVNGQASVSTGRDANGAVYTNPPPTPTANSSLIIVTSNGGMRG